MMTAVEDYKRNEERINPDTISFLPTTWCAHLGHVDTMKLFIEEGADIDSPAG